MTADEFDRILAAGDPHLRLALLVLAGLSGGAMIRHDASAWPLPDRERAGVMLAAVAGGLAGAYLPGRLAGGLAGQWLASRGPPMTILGALFFSFVAVAGYKRLAGIGWDTSDAFVRGTCLQMAVGRLGCHASHCCLGVPAGIPSLGLDFGDGIPRVPVQLLESGAMFGLFLAFDRLHRRDLLPGRRLFLLFLVYGVLRFGLEAWREPMGAVRLGIGAYQGFALGLAGVGAWQMVRRSGRLAGEVPA